MNSSKPHILTINGGSSSIKFSLFKMDGSLRLLLEGEIEKVGELEATLLVKGIEQSDNFSRIVSIPDNTAAVEVLMDWVEKRCGHDSLTAVGHRIVNGGSKYSKAQNHRRNG